MKKVNLAAHGLTSMGSIALLEKRKQKNIEEKEDKERKKKERQMKKVARVKLTSTTVSK